MGLVLSNYRLKQLNTKKPCRFRPTRTVIYGNYIPGETMHPGFAFHVLTTTHTDRQFIKQELSMEDYLMKLLEYDSIIHLIDKSEYDRNKPRRVVISKNWFIRKAYFIAPIKHKALVSTMPSNKHSLKHSDWTIG